MILDKNFLAEHDTVIQLKYGAKQRTQINIQTMTITEKLRTHVGKLQQLFIRF